MIKYASGGPTGVLFRAKARGFNALRTETWERGQHTFDWMPPPMSPSPAMALRLLPSIALSSRLATTMIAWCCEMARGIWHESLQYNTKTGGPKAVYITKQGSAVST